MKRSLYFAALVAAVLLASVPAIAGHVAEPTAPVVGLELNLSNYASGTAIACGSTVDFPKLRIDPIVTVEARPSEHWRARLTLHSAVNRGANWYLDWQHQNVPPHARSNRWVFGQGSQNLIRGADYEVVLEVWGDKSGNYFVQSCAFNTAP